jgi:thymidylate synthase (FAD)
MIKAERFHLTNTKNDFCDIARVSFARGSNEFTDEQNNRLISYLVKHKHWTPFGHNRIMLPVSKLFIDNLMYHSPNLRASVVVDSYQTMSNSVWGWYQMLKDGMLTNGYFEPVLSELGRYGLIDHKTERTILPYFDPIHSPISFRCSAPMFVARQLGKHQVSACWNEESRRYISTDPECYVPDNFRLKPEGSIKQGSGETLTGDANEWYRIEMKEHHRKSIEVYKKWISNGVAPELARSILPQSTMVNWIWTSTLAGWNRVLQQRLDSHAQYETRLFAEQIQKGLEGV